MTDYITIKGARGGLRVQILDTCEWSDALIALKKQLTDGAALLHGMKLSLDLGERELSVESLDELHTLMREYQNAPVDILSESRTVRAEARTMGFIAKPPLTKSTAVEAEQTSAVMARNVRSGQILRHHGDVMLLGDVNAGAEVIASGSVMVFGSDDLEGVFLATTQAIEGQSSA
jgi:septum site-determining protein MinC